MARATEQANEAMTRERETVERLKAQTGLLLQDQSRHVKQRVLDYHARNLGMLVVHDGEHIHRVQLDMWWGQMMREIAAAPDLVSVEKAGHRFREKYIAATKAQTVEMRRKIKDDV